MLDAIHVALIERAHPGHACGGDVLPKLTSDTTMRASAFNIAWEFLLGPFIIDGVQGWVKNGTGSLALGNSVLFNGSLPRREPLFSSRECQGSQSINPIYQGAGIHHRNVIGT